MDNLPSDLPIWLAVALFALNLFHKPLGGLLETFLPAATREHFRNRAVRQAERDQHQQNIDEYEQLRRSWLEENYMQILQEKDQFERGLFTELTGAFREQTDELQKVRRLMIRNNDLMTAMNITMNKLSEQLVKNGRGGYRVDGQEESATNEIGYR